MKITFKNNTYLYLSLLSYFISLLLPIDLEVPGVLYLVYGWMIFPEIDFFCWLANLFIILSWIFNKKKIGFLFGWISFFLMISCGIDYVFRLNIFKARHYDQILLAYWFWLLSSVFLVVKAIKQRGVHD